jgi:hypothetical protein
MPLFNVALEGTVVLHADTPDEARRKWRGSLSKYLGCLDELTATSVETITSESDLVDQWEPDCLPYGLPVGDYRKISEILRQTKP